jgi:ribosomal protein L35
MSNHFLQKKSGARKRGLAGLEPVQGKAKKTLKQMLGA